MSTNPPAADPSRSSLSRSGLSRHWPLFGLTLTTPRLQLAPLSDDDLAELVDLALAGIHHPARMPFLFPWTDAPAEQLVAETLRYHWRTRAADTPKAWSVNFGVRSGGVLVGTQELAGENFAVTRSVSTGSWLGLAHQGKGVGTEMRAAVLTFALDSLGARRAESGAFQDNPASLAVSRKLGYAADGTRVVQRRPGEAATEQRLLVTPDTFVRPGWALRVDGLERCRAVFGV